MKTIAYGGNSILLTALALLCACSDAPAPGAAWSVDTLAGGAVRVRNPDVGVWGENEGWRLVEELRIGAVEGAGPEVFGDVQSLSFTVDDDGRIYVLDAQASEVRVFDSSGAHVRSFGRRGAGPGELRRGVIAGWGPEGALWVTDQANARYSAFTPAGELVATHRRTSRFSMRPWPGTIDTAGRILDVAVRGRDERVIIRVEPGTGATDTFPLPHYDQPSFDILNAAGRPMRSAGVPYAGRLLWKLDSTGHLWSAVTDRYRIVRQTLAGDTVRIIELEREPQTVTAEDRDRALEDLADFVEAGGRVDASRIPSTKPLLHDFLLDDRGGVWVVPVPSQRGMLDVFDPEGRYLGKVATPVPLVTWTAAPLFRGDHVYGFTLDDLSVPYLVRLRIERD